MDTSTKIEIARELGFEIVDGIISFKSSVTHTIMRLLPLLGTPEERLCALIDNIEAALTFPDGRLKIEGCKGLWKVGFEWAIGKLPETVRQEHAANSYTSRLEATVAALELADRLRATAPPSRWGLRANKATVSFPAALELAVSRCGGEYYEGEWWLETEDRPGEVELADLSARLDAQLRAGDIVFDAVEHEGRWYVQRDPGWSEIAAKVFSNCHQGLDPWFQCALDPTYTKSYGTELEALVAALGYAEECRSLQAPDVVEGFHVQQCKTSGRWYVDRKDGAHLEHRRDEASDYLRWGRNIDKTIQGDVTKYPVMHFATREEAAAHRDELVRMVSTSQSSNNEVEQEHKTMTKIGEFEVRRHIASFYIYSTVTDDRLRAAVQFYWNDPNNTEPTFFPSEEAATHAARLLDGEWRRISGSSQQTSGEWSDTPFHWTIDDESIIRVRASPYKSGGYIVSFYDGAVARGLCHETKDVRFDGLEAANAYAKSFFDRYHEGQAMTANTTALATITELALPGLLRGALITVQRELVELAIPIVRRVARVEIKAWHRFAAAFSPKLKARLQLDRQIANLVVSVLVPCALYEAACRIEWIRKNENVMTFLRASIDAGCTEAGRLLAEPGLAFAKDGLTMLTRAVKEEKRRGELRAASRRLLEDMTGRDRRVVAEAEREVVELARSLGGVG